MYTTNLICIFVPCSYKEDVYKRQDPKSKQYVGSAIPKVYGGFTNNFSWKGLNLSVFFSYSVGGKMYDSNYQRLMHAGSLGHALSLIHIYCIMYLQWWDMKVIGM